MTLRLLVLLLGLACPAGAADLSPTATAHLADRDGATVGDAELRQTPHGVLITLRLTAAPPGVHALHIHERGTCFPPFESAGGHLERHGRKHGVLDPRGPHAGDLPNVHVPPSGRLVVELFAERVTIAGGPAALLDRDGAALVLHERADDHRTDPAGNAGARIACGVVR